MLVVWQNHRLLGCWSHVTSIFKTHSFQHMHFDVASKKFIVEHLTHLDTVHSLKVDQEWKKSRLFVLFMSFFETWALLCCGVICDWKFHASLFISWTFRVRSHASMHAHIHTFMFICVWFVCRKFCIQCGFNWNRCAKLYVKAQQSKSSVFSSIASQVPWLPMQIHVRVSERFPWLAFHNCSVPSSVMSALIIVQVHCTGNWQVVAVLSGCHTLCDRLRVQYRVR